jgi:hypothetical protein
MHTRRTFLQSAAAAATVLSCSRSSGDEECPGCRVAEPDDDELALSTEPDFRVESAAKTHRVYWRDEDHFAEKWGDASIAAYAGLDADCIVLNSGFGDLVDSTVVAHEVGHNLGHRHVDGTLMDPVVGATTDARPDVAFGDVTRDVFARLEDVRLCDWTDGLDDLQAVAGAFGAGEASIGTLGYAARRYAGGVGEDAFYDHDWPGLGGNAPGRSLSGSFY